MRVGDLRNSTFLTQDDCEPPIVVTADRVEKQNVALPDEKSDEKWCLYFKEPDIKPCVLNKTNGEIMEEITGSDDSDDWLGKQFVFYRDESVRFAGKKVGGIRVRKYEPPQADGLDQDIPF